VPDEAQIAIRPRPDSEIRPILESGRHAGWRHSPDLFSYSDGYRMAGRAAISRVVRRAEVSKLCAILVSQAIKYQNVNLYEHFAGTAYMPIIEPGVLTLQRRQFVSVPCIKHELRRQRRQVTSIDAPLDAHFDSFELDLLAIHKAHAV